MTYSEVLAYVEKKLGKAPRRFGFWDKQTWFKQDFPDWNWQAEDIRHSILNWEKCFTQGKLTWGRIVQANKLMFEKTQDLNNNCPGELLIWTDDWSTFDDETSGEITDALFDLKGNSDEIEDEELKQYAIHLEKEMTRPYGVKIPNSIAGGLNLHASTIFYQRRHIPGPGHYLSIGFFPVLYLEGDPMVVVMVPYKFWPKEFLALWEE